MNRRIIPVTVLSAALLAGCAHSADKTTDMLAYEEARDGERGELVAQRSPEEASLAQQEYGMALEAHSDKEPRIAAHHTRMADLHWRTAEARSDAMDAAEARRTADDRLAEAEVRLEEAKQRVALASVAVERLEKIAALQGRLDSAEGALSSQKNALEAREDVGDAIIAVKDAETWGARDHAPDELQRATASLEAATAALERNELGEARARAKEAMRSAEKATALAKPKYEAERDELALEAKRRALFDAAKRVPGAKRRMTEGGVTVTLHNLFTSGNVQVSSDRLDVLAAIEELAKAFPEFSIVIEGHTDDRGKPSRNLTLSQGRAQAVMAHLSEQGVSPSRMTSTGKGADAPIANNRSKAGRAENRRIEVIFVQPRTG